MMVESLSQRMRGARKFEIGISLQNAGGSVASARRLKPGLVRKAPNASLSEVFWIVFNRAKVDLLARLLIGAP